MDKQKVSDVIEHGLGIINRLFSTGWVLTQNNGYSLTFTRGLETRQYAFKGGYMRRIA